MNWNDHYEKQFPGFKVAQEEMFKLRAQRNELEVQIDCLTEQCDKLNARRRELLQEFPTLSLQIKEDWERETPPAQETIEERLARGERGIPKIPDSPETRHARLKSEAAPQVEEKKP